MVRYEYDAWGNHSVSGSNVSLGKLNPFRYRGYYYDAETELYYLQTRYYDPELGRFITIDATEYLDPETINGLNLYAYCANNPVMNVDPTGTFLISTFFAILATVALSAVVSGLMSGAVSYASGEGFWSGFAGGVLAGIITTIGVAIAVGTGGVGGMFIAGFFGIAAGFSGSILQQGIAKGFDNINWGVAAISGAMTGISSMLTFGFSYFLMSSSVGLFEDCFDPALKFGERITNILKMSPEALILSISASYSFSFMQMLIDFLRLVFGSSIGDNISNVKFSKK